MKGPSREKTNIETDTPLHNAAKNGKLYSLSELLSKGADINAKDSYGITALIYATMAGRDAIVANLLDKGADTEAKDNHGRTALIYAIMAGRDAIVANLLDKGANTEAKDDYDRGKTALHCAASSGRDAIVANLLDKGADIDAKDINGTTALIYATMAGRDATVKHLLDEGADIDAKDNNGQTAWYYVKPFYPKISEFLRQESERRRPILTILDKLFVNTLNLLNKSLTFTQQESQADSNDNLLSNEKGQFLSSELKEPPKATEEELQEFLTIENGRFELKESPKRTAFLTDEEAQVLLDLKNQKIIKKSLTKLLSIDDVKFDFVDGVSSVEYKTKKSSTESETNSVPSLKVLAFKTLFENLFEGIKKELRIRLETDTTPEKESKSLKKATTTSEKEPETSETTPSSSTTPQSAIAAKGSNNSKSNQKT